MKTTRPTLNTFTNTFEYTDAQLRTMRASSARAHAATIARNAAAEGLTVEQYLDTDRLFAAFD